MTSDDVIAGGHLPLLVLPTGRVPPEDLSTIGTGDLLSVGENSLKVAAALSSGRRVVREQYGVDAKGGKTGLNSPRKPSPVRGEPSWFRPKCEE